MKPETPINKVILLPNGVIVRPKNIQRVVPYGSDYRDTLNTSQISETFWLKLVESKSEHTVKFATKEERDEFSQKLLSQLNQ